MKKKIIPLMLAVLMAVTMTLGVIGCKGPIVPPDPPTGLTPEQQVQIAKDTLNSINNAIANRPENSINIMASIPSFSNIKAYAEESEQTIEKIIDELFDRYEWEEADADIYQFEVLYIIFTGVLENLLEQKGVSALNYDYEVETIYENNPSGEETLTPDFINFIGVKQENGYDWAYSIMKKWLADMEYYITVKSYYKSDTDYGYEFVMDLIYFGTDKLSTNYIKFDKKASIIWVNMEFAQNEDTPDILNVARDNKSIRKIIDEENILVMKNSLSSFQEYFNETAISLEKSNNNNQRKLTAQEKVITTFDYSIISDYYAQFE